MSDFAKNIDANIAKPNGHYSHVVELPNGTIQMCGIKAWDASTGELSGSTISEQTNIVFDSILSALNALNLDEKNITRISCHLSDPDDYAGFNEVYSSRLGSSMPARTVLAGYKLRGGALVELVVDAFRPSGECAK
jgi:2-iminobutanoate/2-iminopropanoate deaminase